MTLDIAVFGIKRYSSELKALVFISLTLAIAGLFFSFHGRKLVISEEIFFPQMDKFRPLATQLALTCNSSSNLTRSSASNFSEWLAPRQVWHSMSEEELMWRASLTPHVEEYPYRQTAKVAFMFLSRGGLPLAPLWEKFFEGNEGLFSIYVHYSPEYKDETPERSVFYNRKIPSKPVEWGRASMIDAERRLLANALLDFSNQRFILLSETCIPLFNFTRVYNYLLSSNHSFLSSFDDPRKMGRGRYNKRMWPLVSIWEWRKGSQWFEVHRQLAVEIVSDRKYYPVFRDHCKPSCYIDEHYLPTLVTKLFPAWNSNRSITWVDWSRGGSHPKSFGKKDVSERFVNEIQYGSNCNYNGNKSDVCFLFARKFVASALEPLMRIIPTLFGVDL